MAITIQLPKWFQVIALLASLFGAYTGYHFYFQPTGVAFQGRPLSRAELIDFVINQEIKRVNLPGPSGTGANPTR